MSPKIRAGFRGPAFRQLPHLRGTGLCDTCQDFSWRELDSLSTPDRNPLKLQLQDINVISCSARNAIRIEQTADKPTHPVLLIHTHTHRGRVFDIARRILPSGRINASSPTQGKFNLLLTSRTDNFQLLLNVGFVQTRMWTLNVAKKVKQLCPLNRWTFCFALHFDAVTVWQERLLGHWEAGEGNPFLYPSRSDCQFCVA